MGSVFFKVFQGIGASALSTLNTALIPDLFVSRNRVQAMGYVGVTQSIGSELLPLVGGLLASITWYRPSRQHQSVCQWVSMSSSIVESTKPELNQRSDNYFVHAKKYLGDRRVMELCFFTFGFIFVGFGCFVSYIPSFMNDRFACGPILIGIIIAARALSGAVTSALLGQMTLLFSSRTLVVSSFLIMTTGLTSLPLVTSPWGVMFSALCYGAAFGIIRPLVQIHLFEIAPEDLRATFSSAIGMAIRIAQTVAPLIAGLLVATVGFNVLYLAAVAFSGLMAGFALSGSSLKPENKKIK